MCVCVCVCVCPRPTQTWCYCSTGLQEGISLRDQSPSSLNKCLHQFDCNHSHWEERGKGRTGRRREREGRRGRRREGERGEEKEGGCKGATCLSCLRLTTPDLHRYRHTELD